MKRRVIHIDEEKCTGCGLCVHACHEGAIGLVGGKARLLRDDYCDGLGDCLPACSEDAIEFIEREAAAYDEAAVIAEKMRRAQAEIHASMPAGGCPGSMAKTIVRDTESGAGAGMGTNAGSNEGAAASMPASTIANVGAYSSASAGAGAAVNAGGGMHTNSGANAAFAASSAVRVPARLSNWPVQIKLAPVNAPYFQGCDLLVAADCTAFAYGAFHEDFLKDRVCLIGCPKLDGVDYTEKLAEIIAANNVRSVRVARMQVPCCGGLEQAVRRAVAIAGSQIGVGAADDAVVAAGAGGTVGGAVDAAGAVGAGGAVDNGGRTDSAGNAVGAGGAVGHTTSSIPVQIDVISSDGRIVAVG